MESELLSGCRSGARRGGAGGRRRCHRHLGETLSGSYVQLRTDLDGRRRGCRRPGGESSFKNWLYRIAVNVAHTHRGKRARQAPVWQRRLEADDVSEQHLTDHTENLEESVIHRQALDRALSTLSEEMRAPLVLHDVEGLEYREIAEILDVPIGTIMSRIFRARQRMRPLLVDLLGPRDAIPANESEGSEELAERHRGRIVI